MNPLHLLTYFGLYATLAISLNFIVGFGRITLAHGAIYATGAYCYAIVALTVSRDLTLSVPLAVGLGVGLGALLSALASRFRGDQFVLMSLVVQTLIYEIIRNWERAGVDPVAWMNLTNGTKGLAGVPRPSIAGFSLSSPCALAILSLSFACASTLVSWILFASPFGRVLKAARDDEIAARGLGKDVCSTRRIAFGLSGGMAALAGVVYASYARYVDPSLASLDESVLILTIVLVGGAGSRLLGPLTGAFFVLAVPEVLRFVKVTGATASSVQLLLYGIALVLITHLRPRGLAGEHGIR